MKSMVTICFLGDKEIQELSARSTIITVSSLDPVDVTGSSRPAFSEPAVGLVRKYDNTSIPIASLNPALIGLVGLIDQQSTRLLY